MAAPSASSSPPTPRPETCLFDFDDLEEAGDVEPAQPVPRQASPPRHVASAPRRTAREAQRHFLTFGAGNYQASALRLANEVRALGDKVFQVVHAFTELPEAVAADPRWERHTRGDSKGYGWWFWKSAMVNHLLSEGVLQDGDTLAYGDSGCIVNWGSQRAWLDLIERVEARGSVDFVAFQHEHLEKFYTKGDTFARFGVPWDDRDYGLTCQLVGGYWVTRIGTKTRALFKHWEALAADTRLISDDKPEVHNPCFVTNRHDQSLLSMLVKGNQPEYERADDSHFNAAARDDERPTHWRFASAPRRHREFGITGLRIVVLRDCGWPVTSDPAQPIAAARLSDSALFSGSGELQECA
mmetsp:Transcript_58674/g.132242  ORF Transcript_58674/g.132242 Transcript_58674/m.132242 type:complete len:355 (+) Transcript_58674:103-1167(+)